MTRDWAAKHGFTLYPDKGFESLTLTCVNNGAKPGGRASVDVPKLQKLVKDQGFLIDGGYGKIKGTTFRVSNMGDETEATMGQLFAAMDKAMAQLKWRKILTGNPHLRVAGFSFRSLPVLQILPCKPATVLSACATTRVPSVRWLRTRRFIRASARRRKPRRFTSGNCTCRSACGKRPVNL